MKSTRSTQPCSPRTARDFVRHGFRLGGPVLRGRPPRLPADRRPVSRSRAHAAGRALPRATDAGPPRGRRRAGADGPGVRARNRGDPLPRHRLPQGALRHRGHRREIHGRPRRPQRGLCRGVPCAQGVHARGSARGAEHDQLHGHQHGPAGDRVPERAGTDPRLRARHLRPPRPDGGARLRRETAGAVPGIRRGGPQCPRGLGASLRLQERRGTDAQHARLLGEIRAAQDQRRLPGPLHVPRPSVPGRAERLSAAHRGQHRAPAATRGELPATPSWRLARHRSPAGRTRSRPSSRSPALRARASVRRRSVPPARQAAP